MLKTTKEKQEGDKNINKNVQICQKGIGQHSVTEKRNQPPEDSKSLQSAKDFLISYPTLRTC